MPLQKKKEKKGGERVVELEKCDPTCSVHKPLTSRVFFAQAVKTGVFALLLFTAKHLDWRLGEARLELHALLQVQSESFNFRLGDIVVES